MKTLATVFAAALMIGGAISAQSNDRITLKLPTAVTINGITLPAGDASIEVLRDTGSVILAVRSASGQTVSVLASRFVDETDEAQPKVILDHKGDIYRLNRILLPQHLGFQVLEAE